MSSTWWRSWAVCCDSDVSATAAWPVTGQAVEIGRPWYTSGMTSTLLIAAALTVALSLGPWPAASIPQEVSPAATCPEGEGKALPGPQGLTFCSGTARVEIRAAEEPQDGVRIVSVAAGSAAASAGFQPGDLVYRAGGEWVSTGAEAIKRLEALQPGQEAVVNFWRDGLPFLIRVRGQ
jgi:hypothetical protein